MALLTAFTCIGGERESIGWRRSRVFANPTSARDYTTNPKEIMRAVDDLIRAGKVNYAMISDTPAW
jgi:hypothetical protein